MIFLYEKLMNFNKLSLCLLVDIFLTVHTRLYIVAFINLNIFIV